MKGYRCAQMVVLEISDTGAGIHDGLDVFESLRTTKRDGSEVGLPLVWQIVSAHNGTINYTRLPGPGHRTKFQISLPAADLGSKDRFSLTFDASNESRPVAANSRRLQSF